MRDIILRAIYIAYFCWFLFAALVYIFIFCFDCYYIAKTGNVNMVFFDILGLVVLLVATFGDDKEHAPGFSVIWLILVGIVFWGVHLGGDPFEMFWALFSESWPIRQIMANNLQPAAMFVIFLLYFSPVRFAFLKHIGVLFQKGPLPEFQDLES